MFLRKFRKKGIIIIIGLLLTFVLSFGPWLAIPSYAIDTNGRAIGIDVSNHNGTLDWEAIKNNGIDFAIIRVGWGDNEEYQHDPEARRNIRECERLGIPYGVYIYSYAISEKEVENEVDHVCTMIDGYYPPLGIWFDMEDADYYKDRHNFNPYTHGSQLTSYCIKFMSMMYSRGYDVVGVYANLDYFRNVLDYDAIAANGYIWLARWGSSEPGLSCDIWQWADNGHVAGSSELTDMNYIFAEGELYSIILDYSSGVEDEEDEEITDDEERIAGDVNGDGKVSPLDYVAVKNHILEKKIITDEKKLAYADVNRDGKISPLDYVKIKKIILQEK